MSEFASKTSRAAVGSVVCSGDLKSLSGTCHQKTDLRFFSEWPMKTLLWPLLAAGKRRADDKAVPGVCGAAPAAESATVGTGVPAGSPRRPRCKEVISVADSAFGLAMARELSSRRRCHRRSLAQPVHSAHPRCALPMALMTNAAPMYTTTPSPCCLSRESLPVSCIHGH